MSEGRAVVDATDLFAANITAHADRAGAVVDATAALTKACGGPLRKAKRWPPVDIGIAIVVSPARGQLWRFVLRFR